MIIRAGTVVTLAGEPIDNGAVAVSDTRIIDVGKFSEISAQYSGQGVLDLGEQVLLPGLINAHCHLDYTALRDKIPAPQSFADWIHAINAEKNKLAPGDYVASINEGFAEAQRFGTTTIVNLTAFPELIGEIEAPIRTWWFGELIDVRNPDAAQSIVDLAVESLKSAEHWGLAPHAPFTASKQLYALCEEVARRDEVLLTTHLAESREEMQMFRDRNGPLYDFLKSIGRQMDDCGDRTPLSFLARHRTLDERWILTHLNELTEGDFDLLGNARKFHIAHCPRSHSFLGHPPFELQRLRALGFNICLGTDSLASNSSLSLFAEMRELLRKEPWLSPIEVLKMTTSNAAHAIGQADSLGTIKPGFRADLIAIPSPRVGSGVFDGIVAFDGTVSWMMMDGEELGVR